MRINPLPFIFAPGAALAGYVVNGAHGAWLGGLAWTVIVALATLSAFVRRAK